jgi:hypothetical protein
LPLRQVGTQVLALAHQRGAAGRGQDYDGGAGSASAMQFPLFRGRLLNPSTEEPECAREQPTKSSPAGARSRERFDQAIEVGSVHGTVLGDDDPTTRRPDDPTTQSKNTGSIAMVRRLRLVRN